MPAGCSGAAHMVANEPEIKSSVSFIPCFLFVELVLMAGTVILSYHFEYTDTFPVHSQGFFCYDSTLSKPYPGPESASRVPPRILYPLITVLPVLTILLGEVSTVLINPRWSNREKIISCGDCCFFNPLLRRIVRILGLFSFGLFCTVIFAGAVQTVTGNQAPHFLSVCRPNYTALGCKSHMQYISTPYACDGDPDLIIEARKAFPSKPAALGAYAAVYTTMYVTLVLKVKGSRLVKPSLCLALLSPSWLLCLLRVAEYRNHWRDVLAGTITGAAIAVFLVTCVLNNFGSSSPEEGDLIQKEQEGVFEAEIPLQTACEKLSVAKDLGSSPTDVTRPSSVSCACNSRCSDPLKLYFQSSISPAAYTARKWGQALPQKHHCYQELEEAEW
ncbi:phospholipid phosphatase-related protein type 2 isoform 1-T1 [Anomaloglossus baeobatrachus]|uniref:phospholipid phosphatase-related protein type 2 isoform X1 n=1 Tax=Anomaloglossus baeobatrachus TaxID=238106 RepID=UPI003F4FDA7C